MFRHLPNLFIYLESELKLGLILHLSGSTKTPQFFGADPAVTNESVEQTDGVTVLASHSSPEFASVTEQVEDTSGIVESLSENSVSEEYSGCSTGIPARYADGRLLAYGSIGLLSLLGIDDTSPMGNSSWCGLRGW